MKEINITCACGAEMIKVVWFDEYPGKEFDLMIYRSWNTNHPFWYRFKVAWDALMGRFYATSFCIYDDDAKKLAKFIRKNL